MAAGIAAPRRPSPPHRRPSLLRPLPPPSIPSLSSATAIHLPPATGWYSIRRAEARCRQRGGRSGGPSLDLVLHGRRPGLDCTDRSGGVLGEGLNPAARRSWPAAGSSSSPAWPVVASNLSPKFSRSIASCISTTASPTAPGLQAERFSWLVYNSSVITASNLRRNYSAKVMPSFIRTDWPGLIEGSGALF